MPGRGRASFTLLVTAAAVAAVVLPAALVPSAAQAASYRYWSYWLSSGDGWTYSSQGAGSMRPKDGTVQGWRFAVSQGASSSTIAPRTAPSFASLCNGVEPAAGTRRVGLVIDYGIAADAPSGEKPPGPARYCVRIADGGTGLAVLTAVTTVRAKAGLVCGISGFPKSECTAIVKEAPAAPPAPRPSVSTGGAGTSTEAQGATSSVQSQERTTAGTAAPTTSGKASPGAGASAPVATPSTASTTTTEGEAADVVDATRTSAQGPAGNPLPTVIALALVVVIGAAIVIARRRRS